MNTVAPPGESLDIRSSGCACLGRWILTMLYNNDTITDILKYKRQHSERTIITIDFYLILYALHG